MYLPGDRVVQVSSNGWRWNAGWEGTPMLTVVPDPAGRDSSAPASLIDEIVREGARRMLAEALQAEVDAYIAAFAAERDETGSRLVVRNGYHQSREVLTSAGAVQVTAPRVNDKRTDPITGERKRFSSAILPPWARKTPKVTEVLPLLYHRLVLLVCWREVIASAVRSDHMRWAEGLIDVRGNWPHCDLGAKARA
jgi:hypothetical protein